MQRLSIDNTEKDTNAILFQEIKDLRAKLRKKSKKNKRYSIVMAVLNAVINLTVTVSAAVIIGITAYYNLQNLATIILGAVIFLFSSLNMILKLGARGFYYRKSSVRLLEIEGSLKDILFKFNNYTRDQILIFLDFFRSEISNTDLELYKKSLIGEVALGQDGQSVTVSAPDLEWQESPVYKRKSVPILSAPETFPHENSPRGSPHKNSPHKNSPHKNSPRKNSPRDSPRRSHGKNSPRGSPRKNSPRKMKISPGKIILVDSSDDSDKGKGEIEFIRSELYRKEHLNKTISLPNLNNVPLEKMP